MNRDDFKTIVSQAVCRHMPTAAVASGMISSAHGLYDAEIERLSCKFPYAWRPDNYRLSFLRKLLADRGEALGDGLLLALQREWLRVARNEEFARIALRNL